MNNHYNKFAHAGIPEGETLAQHASNGQGIPGNCNDKNSSGKMKKWFGKAMAIAMALVFAMATHVTAQTVTVGTTSAATYFPFFTNSSATAPVVGNSNVNETGGSLNVGDGELRVNTYGGFGTCFIEARNAASTGTIDMTLRTLNSGTVFNNIHLTPGELMGINSDEYTGGTAPTAPLDLYQNSGGSGTTAIFKIWDNNPTQRFTVLGNGKVGIGVSAPTNFLDLKSLGNSSSTNAFNIVNSSSTQLFEVRDDGNVGIGTSSPGAQLDQELSPGAVSTDITGIKASTTTSSTTHAATGISATATNNGTSGVATGVSVSSNNSASGTTYGENITSTTSAGSLVWGTLATGTNNNTAAGTTAFGIEGSSTTSGGTSTSYGVDGLAEFNSGVTNSTAYGVFGTTSGCGSTGNHYYGVCGTASGCAGSLGVYCVGNGGYTGTWTLISDQKVKDNIQPMSSALENLMKLQPKTYTFKTTEFPAMKLSEGPQMGLISQDVEKIFPSLVRNDYCPATTDKDGKILYPGVDYKGLNYIGFIPVIISSIQQQQDTIVKQQTVIQKQQSQIAAQQTQNAQLQNSVIDLQSKYNSLQNQNGQLQNSLSDLQNQFSSVLAEIEQLKTIQAECCGSVGANSTTGSNNNAGNSTDQPSLAQNVPNPFTQSTVISYYLPASTPNAVITIRSLTGTTLQSFNIAAAGHGQITVSQGTLAPATYEYDMIVNGKLIDSKKMVIIGE